MSEAKHTPGPWIVHRGSRWQNDRDCMAVIDSIPNRDGQVVANCICHVAGTNPSKIDNAQLIAAAPDLLAACEACIAADQLANADGTLGDDMVAAYDAAIAAAKAAIAKAKG
jgi:hypothetical protein